MKKTLMLFVVLLVALFVAIGVGSGDLALAGKVQTIAQAPQEVRATLAGIDRAARLAKLSFESGGRTFTHVEPIRSQQQLEILELAQGAWVMHSAEHPEVSLGKSTYESLCHGACSRALWQSAVTVALLATVPALTLALLVSWRRRWWARVPAADDTPAESVVAAAASVRASPAASAPLAPPGGRPQDAALLHAIAERSKVDPLVGAKLGAKDLCDTLIEALKDARGVHVESLLCALGSLAGYACQASLRAQAIARGQPANSPFMLVKSRDGRQFFFGDALNQPLAQSQHSVWSLAAATAQHLGCKELPDLHEIFKHVSSTVGGDAFGIPRIAEGHRPAARPIEYLALWRSLEAKVKTYCPKPEDWPVMFGLAIQQVMELGKSAIEPKLALIIVMESAVPMSKVEMAFSPAHT